MSKAYKGQNCGNVLELTLQDEQEFKTPTIAWSGTTNGEIDQVQGDIPDLWKTDGGSGTQLTQIQIGSSCTSIGSQAFAYCYGFSGDLVIADSVTTIGSYAFYYCDSLTGDLVIPDSVTSIGSHAFGYWGISTPIGTLTIGNSVTSIGSYAFSYSYFTGDLIIPDSVTTIGDSGFADWIFSHVMFNGNIVIGSGVTSIGSSAFYGVGTTALYINCPASSWIGTNALLQTSPLTNIYVHADYVTVYDATWKGNQQTSATVSTWANYPNIP
jgi:hypothetical protein